MSKAAVIEITSEENYPTWLVSQDFDDEKSFEAIIVRPKTGEGAYVQVGENHGMGLEQDICFSHSDDIDSKLAGAELPHRYDYEYAHSEWLDAVEAAYEKVINYKI